MNEVAEVAAFLLSDRRRPVFALMAVSILALGLSSSVAVYTYVRAFSQPFPGVGHCR